VKSSELPQDVESTMPINLKHVSLFAGLPETDLQAIAKIAIIKA